VQQPPAEGARGAFGDFVSYRANPQLTGYTPDDSAFGPLFKLWSRRFKGPVSTPLITRGRVIANVANSDGTRYGSRVVAFDPRTGRTAWSRPTPGTYFSSHLAIDGGRLVALNTEGVLRAFTVADGRPLWTFRTPDRSFTSDYIPVAAGGTAYFVAYDTGSSNTYLFAVDMRTGAMRWRQGAPVVYGPSQPALDGRRVYTFDTCGRVAAFRRSDGAELWRRGPDEDCRFRAGGFVLGDRLFAAGGFEWDAASGAARGHLRAGVPDAAVGGLGFMPWEGGAVRALSLRDGATRWRRKGDTGGYGDALRPIVARQTVYVGTSNGKLLGFDRADGTLFSVEDLRYESYSSVGGIHPGMASGHGVLAATGGTRLTAYAPVLRPDPRGTDVAASSYDVEWGKKTYFVGGLGAVLRHRRPVRRVRLEADQYPFKRFRTADHARTMRNGTVFFGGRLQRNTRVRIDVDGRRDRARFVTVYVYPRKKWSFHALGFDRIQVLVTMHAGKDFHAGGHRLFVYWRHRRQSHVTRIGSDTMHQTGSGTAHGEAIVPRPAHSRRSDQYYWCVAKLHGYGRGTTPFDRHCGARRIRL
jgi:outer membrane protein assembly factor BamB